MAVEKSVRLAVLTAVSGFVLGVFTVWGVMAMRPAAQPEPRRAAPAFMIGDRVVTVPADALQPTAVVLGVRAADGAGLTCRNVVDDQAVDSFPAQFDGTMAMCSWWLD